MRKAFHAAPLRAAPGFLPSRLRSSFRAPERWWDGCHARLAWENLVQQSPCSDSCQELTNQITQPVKAQPYMQPPVGIRCMWLSAKGPPPMLASISRGPRRFITIAAGCSAGDRIAMLEAAGFDRESAVKMASSHPRVLSLDVESRIALLEAAGFDRKVVLKMASSFPQVLGLDVERRIALLEAAGFDRKVVLKMASTFPPVLGYDVESRIALLEAVDFDRMAVVKMASSFPQVLSLSVEKNILPKLSVLQAAHIDITNITSYPRCFSYSLEGRIKPRLMVLRGRGMQPQTCGEFMYWLSLTDAVFSRRAGVTH